MGSNWDLISRGWDRRGGNRDLFLLEVVPGSRIPSRARETPGSELKNQERGARDVSTVWETLTPLSVRGPRALLHPKIAVLPSELGVRGAPPVPGLLVPSQDPPGGNSDRENREGNGIHTSMSSLGAPEGNCPLCSGGRLGFGGGESGIWEWRVLDLGKSSVRGIFLPAAAPGMGTGRR